MSAEQEKLSIIEVLFFRGSRFAIWRALPSNRKRICQTFQAPNH